MCINIYTYIYIQCSARCRTRCGSRKSGASSRYGVELNLWLRPSEPCPRCLVARRCLVSCDFMLKDVGCLQAEFRFSPMKKANLVGFVALLVISTEMVKPEVTRARTWSDLFQAPSRSVVRGKLSTLSCGESGTPSSATVWLGGRGRVGRLL